MLPEFEAIRRSKLNGLQPCHRGFGWERFGRHLVLQVVSAQDVFDLIDRSAAGRSGIFAERGQSSLLQLNRIGDVDDLELVNSLAGGDAIAEQPQLFAQLGGIAPIGFSTVGLFGLHEHNSIAAKVLQHLQQPVVEATDFDNRPEATIILKTPPCQAFEELEYFFRLGADLSPQNNVPQRITKTNGQLLCMLVNSKVKYNSVLQLGSYNWAVERQARKTASAPTDASSIGEPFFDFENSMFQTYQCTRSRQSITVWP